MLFDDNAKTLTYTLYPVSYHTLVSFQTSPSNSFLTLKKTSSLLKGYLFCFSRTIVIPYEEVAQVKLVQNGARIRGNVSYPLLQVVLITRKGKGYGLTQPQEPNIALGLKYRRWHKFVFGRFDPNYTYPELEL